MEPSQPVPSVFTKGEYMKLEDVGKLTMIELLIHSNEEVKRLAQQIATILIKNGDVKGEITSRTTGRLD